MLCGRLQAQLYGLFCASQKTKQNEIRLNIAERERGKQLNGTVSKRLNVLRHRHNVQTQTRMCISKSLDFFQAVGAASLWMDKYQFMFLKSFNNIIVNEKWKSRQKKKSSSTIGRYSFAEFNWNRMSTMTTDNNIDRPAIPKPIKTFIVYSDLIR